LTTVGDTWFQARAELKILVPAANPCYFDLKILPSALEDLLPVTSANLKRIRLGRASAAAISFPPFLIADERR
jgi:hypothetical protein